MNKEKAVVLVAQVDIPSPDTFGYFLKNALGPRYAPVVQIEEHQRNWDGVGLAESVETVIQTAANLLERSPDALFAAYIMPTAVLIEYTGGTPCEQCPMIFIAIRSKHGNEWFYVDLFGQVNPNIPGTLAPTIDGVLEKRQALCRPVTAAHYSEATIFIESLRTAVGNVFSVQPHVPGTLQ